MAEELTRAHQIILAYLDSRYKGAYKFVTNGASEIKATFDDGTKRAYTINLWGDIMGAETSGSKNKTIAVGNVEHKLWAQNMYALPTEWKDV